VEAQKEVSESILQLLSQDGRRWVVVLEAFIDESGTHKGSAILNVAAMAGAHWQWKKFLSYWDNKPFHARESKYKALKPALFDAIQFGELEGFTAWMEPKDYMGNTTHHFRSVMGNAYAMCTFACAIGVCKFARDEKLGKVAFIIESGQPNIEWIKSVLEYMKAKERFGIASVAIATKKDFVQLCAADFLAHSKSADPAWYQRFFDTRRVSQAHLKSDKLKDICQQIEEGLMDMKRQKQKAKQYAKVQRAIDGMLKFSHGKAKNGLSSKQ
jgi:hypothetical protein